MAWKFYIDNMLLPVAPGKLSISTQGGNKSIITMGSGEINILKAPRLSTVEFEALLPNVEYPFAVYDNGFERADVFLNKLNSLMTDKNAFRFIVTRDIPNGGELHSTNMKVSLEGYTTKESADDGQDVVVSIQLKQYVDYGAKECAVLPESDGVSVSTSTTRPSDGVIGIGSTVIINGVLHKDSHGNYPGQTRTNYRGKINYINHNGSHPYHVTTPSGLWQGWVTEDSVTLVQGG